ncbi:MAG: Ribosomal RNA small subunit methyltransferase H [candidate division WS2 bacterium]|uniref:Ribosomal RNA small subunit methyltransferase H n=1 Tax=Psychracetigena formicireducens TaxID=2986056 RepID=A0A9E2F1M1_PSYF1|nr:Ribosomal RNA small subunit methyltransferase H [Candidatus Psychracetigena formicireducens]MBT9144852.1 Ribosomal RNA small subunit methyltransferase H [Candidatus Psychracetigena formicireducens]MBT9151459.1 Ribosomal RNA small subunit methyltransferase H [Candidatus Psychracetigena formicireducens]
MENKDFHIPVLVDEVISFLASVSEGLLVDCTVGMGGHSEAILERYKGIKIVAVDRDSEALAIAKERLLGFAPRCWFVKNNYREIDIFLSQLNISKVDAVLVDLGISSLQITKPERGFSIRYDGPLDMRMDFETGIPLWEILSHLSRSQIQNIISLYGEENKSDKIASLIYLERHKIKTTGDLKQIVEKAIGYQRRKIHPATRVFQAFRIFINQELDSLNVFLSKLIGHINSHGKIIIISYHSLEDRLIKNYFKEMELKGLGKVLTPKVIKPGRKEILMNPRARSAKMRVLEVV